MKKSVKMLTFSFFLTICLLLMACEDASEVLETSTVSSPERGEAEERILEIAQNIPFHIESQETDSPEKIRAEKMAIDYVKNLEDYRQFNGQNLKIINTLQGRCLGCWIITSEFDLQSEKDPKRTDRATAKVTINAWQIADAVYAKRTINIFSASECGELGGRVLAYKDRAACGENEKIIGEVSGLEGMHLCCQSEGFQTIESTENQTE